MNNLIYLYLKMINKVKIHLFLYEYYYNYYTCMNTIISPKLDQTFVVHHWLCSPIYL